MDLGQRGWVLSAALLVACGGDDAATTDAGTDATTPSDGAVGTDATGSDGGPIGNDASGTDGSSPFDGSTPIGTSPIISGCAILPANHVFNTPIANLPVHPSSAAFMQTIGSHNLHLDLGPTVNMSSPNYFGIPYNVVKGNTLTWAAVAYYSADSQLNWNPRPEADCAVGSTHTLVSPCVPNTAPTPLLPIPAAPLVEGGINAASSMLPYGDHHILVLDSDTCRLWETYHSYPGNGGAWNIFGSASFDLKSNALRPATWTSADAAGFPILPLLIRADEASAGKITHALRFTILSSKIRAEYTWPARHKTGSNLSQSLPPMGQLFRLKAGFAIPGNFTTQAKAILEAMKTYGMYIADGGSDMYVTGEPNATWTSQTINDVQTVSSADFEAVDLAPVRNRAGFDVNSGAVPP